MLGKAQFPNMEGCEVIVSAAPEPLPNENANREDEICPDTAFLHPAKIKAIGCLSKSPYILVKSEKGCYTVFICAKSRDVGKGEIQIRKVGRKNLNVDIGDQCCICLCDDIAPGERVTILPVDKSLKEGMNKPDFFEDLLLTYFARRTISHPICKGDSILVRHETWMVEFKVTYTYPKEYCLVGRFTDIQCGDGCYANFDKIGGCRKQLTQLRELVELPLESQKLFKSIGTEPSFGILLSGPHGSGKMLLACAVAECSGLRFSLVNGLGIIDDVSELREAFKEARDGSIAIIIIDKIDSIMMIPEKNERRARIVSELIALMEDLKEDRSDVIVIATTNHLNSVDPALRQSGYFDQEISIGVPNEAGRLEILQIHTKNMRLAEDVDLSEIAARTEGYVGADIASLCSKAATQHIREKSRSIPLNEVDSDEVVKSLWVTMDNFHFAISESKASSPCQFVVESPAVCWEDIGVLDKVKQELRVAVRYPTEHPEKFLKYGISPSKGGLLYGPPGTGKQLLAKAIANECGAKFINIKVPELLTKWFGESEDNIREVFDKARAAAPCVIFFDEIDAIGNHRGHSRHDSVLTLLLTEMDRIIAEKVVVIGATNRPEQIDRALLRPGRFDQMIYVPLPDEQTRLCILKTKFARSPRVIAMDKTLREVAKESDGLSGADLDEICRHATRFAVRESIDADFRSASETDANGDMTMENDDDPAVEITFSHFGQAMRIVRQSMMW